MKLAKRDSESFLYYERHPPLKMAPSRTLSFEKGRVFSVFTFQNPTEGGRTWEMKEDHVPGDLGFDPLGLKPKDPEKFKEMQSKELNNGRLAMIAAAGMIAQEYVTGQKLF